MKQVYEPGAGIWATQSEDLGSWEGGRPLDKEDLQAKGSMGQAEDLWGYRSLC